jgi:hypothetical protein
MPEPVDAPDRMTQNSPWLNWLAVCLCRFVARREWIALQPLPKGPVCEYDIGMIPEELPHPDLAGWHYVLFTRDVSFTGPDGEKLCLSLEDGRLCNPRCINPTEFDLWLGSVDHEPEMCLKRWLPSQPGGSNRLLQLVLQWVEEQGWMKDGLLAGPFQALYQTGGYAQPEDWPERDVEPEGARSDYYRFLLDLIQTRRRSIDTTQFGWPWELLRCALQALPAEHVDDFSRAILEAPLDSVTAGTVLALNYHDSLQTTSDSVVELLPRALERPELAEAVFTYLLNRSRFLEEVRRSPHGRERQSENILPELTLLALEFCPQEAPPLVRQCLASSDQGARLKAAGLLAEIGQDWCMEELDRAMATAPGDKVLNLSREGRWYELEDTDTPLWRRRMQAVARNVIRGNGT